MAFITHILLVSLSYALVVPTSDKFGHAKVVTNCTEQCPEGYVLCAENKTCIFSHWQCDGVVDCLESEDELDCADYKKNDPDSHFNQAYEAGMKTSCDKSKLLLKKILRKMTPEELTVFSTIMNDYLKEEKNQYHPSKYLFN
uniref:Uncharacterized protein n=1 Tax=Ditylenchus dipsaci TaxID=166011 RepID=A0A915CV90_9BILA